MSGDNSRSDYDESSDMKEALVQLGIPDERIFCDYAGFSTLDSVVRAKKVFLQQSMLVVSQDFHVRRAIYIGQGHGIDLVGYAAKDVEGRAGSRTRIREALARFKAVLDVEVFSRGPKFLGDTIEIALGPDEVE